MRWIIGITICLALGVVAWFWYPRLMENQNTDPLSIIITDNTWAVVQLDEAQDFHVLSDSMSAFRTFESFELLRELALQLPQDKKHWFFIYNIDSTTQFGLITESEVMIDELSHRKNLGRYSVFATDTLDRSESDSEHVKKLLNTSGRGTLKILIKPQKLLSFYDYRLGTALLRMLHSRFNQSGWMALDIEEDNGLFNISGIENSQKEKSITSNKTSLLRYLPGNSGAAAIHSGDSISVAWAYCPYSQVDAGSGLNYFGFIEYSDDQTTPSNLTTEYQGFPISIVSIDSSIFGISVPWYLESYKAQLSEHVSVFAGSFAKLALLIDDYLADDKLISSPYYTALENQVSDASYTLFMRPNLLREERNLLKQANAPNQFNALIYQSFNELPLQQFHSMAILHDKEIKDEAPLAWMSRLDTSIASGPWSFINHYNDEFEVLVQDHKHQLYLINKDGKTLWKKKLDGIINEKLEMVDAFSNGKYQMVFTTLKKLHFIDRNGNYIASYPVTLEKGTTVAPLCVKYKNADDYRIIINDGLTLKNFDTDGNAVEGWKNPVLEAQLKQPVDYLFFNGKDYLVSCNSSNKFRIMDRTGDRRLSANQGDSNVIVYDLHIGSTLNKTHYIGYDSLGKIHLQPLNAKSKTFNILPLGGDIGFETTTLDEFRYISVKNDRVVTLDNNQDVSLDYLMPEGLKSDISVLSESRKWIGFDARENNHFYILDLKGRMLDKMPLKGSGKSILVDLDKNGSMELIIGDGKTALNVYKLAD